MFGRNRIDDIRTRAADRPTRQRRLRSGVASALLFAMTWQPLLVPTSQAAFSAPLIKLYDAPFLVGEKIPPYVMLAVTKDQQLFKKAYDDFSDIDRDGVTDTTYKHAIDYYGYFDSYKCYQYNDGNRRFEPASITADKYCGTTNTTNWSGNFLNWASMTRIDALRKVLYGGLRSPDRGNGDGSGVSDGDTAADTVLERAFLPHDAHSFAKYYIGDDLNQLTPFSANAVSTTGTPTNSGTTITTQDSASIDTLPKRVTVASTTGFAVGDWVQLATPTGSYVRGQITGISGSKITIGNIAPPGVTGTQAVNVYVDPSVSNTVGTVAQWTVSNLSTRGITLCSTTNGGTGIQALSDTNTNLPRLQVARGDFSLWNAQERWQCTWANTEGSGTPLNGNNPQFSGVFADDRSPNQNTFGLDPAGKGAVAGQGNYFVRVQACVSSMIGKERCRQYPSGNYKPIGLLQTFGESDRIRFGLMTGSYKKNLSGGVLRKNVSPIADEINTTTDGTFIDLGAAGAPPSIAPGDPTQQLQGGSIIRSLSLLKIVGYRYDNGTYFGNAGNNDNCPYQRELNTNGECKSWGNPMSEIYYESLRYLAGKTTPTAAFDANDSTIISKLVSAQWPPTSSALMSTKNYCAPLNVLMVNGAVSTSEDDSQITDLSFMDGSPGSAAALTNQAGALAGLSGSYFFGHSVGDSTTGTGYNICSAKSLTGLGDVRSICPEGPTLNGSYLMAGLAYQAHTHRVRTDINLPSSAAKLKRVPLKVDTYGISIAGGIPRVPVKFAGDTEARVVIQPAYRLTQGTFGGGGALVDARIVSQHQTADHAWGQILVTWEDSEAGGDYDMDVWGIISYDMTSSDQRIRITTDAIYQATANPQGFGYVLSGTGQDGLHYHSGILNFSYNDPGSPLNVTSTTAGRLNISGGCNGCQVGDGPSTATYSLSTTPPAKSFEDPLYYASMLGGFDDINKDGVPVMAAPPVGGQTQSSSFDKRDNFAGTDKSDGIPDNFFKVDNPLGLESGLERTFQLISEQSSLATLQSSSTRIVAGTAVYQAMFNSGDWSGSVQALPISGDGSIGAPLWNAATASLAPGQVDPSARKILTMRSDTRAPVKLAYNQLSTAQQQALRTVGTSPIDPVQAGQDRLAWLRGDASKEGDGSTQFRRRSGTVLGDIVNSGPIHVGKPSAGIGSGSYLNFISAQQSRKNVLYVGANDGMLHAFDSSNGNELFAYVPTPVYQNLASLTTQSYTHRYFVDGQIATQDVELPTGSPGAKQWRTYLVGGLGGGGQGVFGLDITDPSAASESNPGAIVKWEFTDEDDYHMGYVYSQPILRQLRGGDWVAIFSSGYNASYSNSVANTENQDAHSTPDGQVSIFALKLTGPSAPNGHWIKDFDYWRIDIDASDVGSNLGAPNGLSGIASYDISGDGKADYLYAGDLFGGLWRADVRNLVTGSSIAPTTRIFKATTAGNLRQPITAPPALSVGPDFTGVFVTFGTGKLLEPSDMQSGAGAFLQQSLYGVWDKNPAVTGASARVTRAQMMSQVELVKEGNSAYANGVADVAALDFSLTSAYVPNYTSEPRTNLRSGNSDPLATGPTATTPANQRGWIFDVPRGTLTGERSIYRPELIGSFAIFVNAMPSALACEGGGSEAQYALEALTGARSNFGGFDRDANGKIQGANGSLMGDQSTFGGAASLSGVAQQFYASRRESTGGFGQMTILKSVGANSLGGATNSAGAAVDACAGGGMAPIGAQSTSTGAIQSQRLPGGCIGRVQWREVVRH